MIDLSTVPLPPFNSWRQKEETLPSLKELDYAPWLDGAAGALMAAAGLPSAEEEGKYIIVVDAEGNSSLLKVETVAAEICADDTEATRDVLAIPE